MSAARTLREVRVQTEPGVELASDRLAVVVLPGLGGRVVSLLDRERGREWLVQGHGSSGNVTRPGSAYDAGVAWGWDECLPTVAPCPDPRVAGGQLRDHGDIWGRPATAAADGGCLRLTSEVDDVAGGRSYSFRRTLSVDDRCLRVDYSVNNRGTFALPLLWSMHPLVALEPRSRFHLPGVTDLLATFAAGQGVAGLLPDGRAQRVGWPAAMLRSGAIHHFDVVPGPDAREAIKLYAGPLARGTAAVSAPNGAWLGYRWDVATAPFLGIWMSNGGWPAAETGVRQHALEPTTAPADSLDVATRQGRAVVVMPGDQCAWWVTLELGSSAQTLDDYLATEGASPSPSPEVPAGETPVVSDRAQGVSAGCNQGLLHLTSPFPRRPTPPPAPVNSQGDPTPWPILRD